MKNNFYAVIMAGGSGKRLWPLSTEDFPKQFLTFGKKEPLIVQTIQRMLPLISKKNIYVVSLKKQEKLLRRFVKIIPSSNFIFEPYQKNTAACLALAAFTLYQKNPNAVMLAAPSDNSLFPEKAFQKDLQKALHLAHKNNVLITFGTQPSFAATGFGYIEKGEEISSNVFKVKKFTEKPKLQKAKKYIKSKNFYWNSGHFAWKASTFLEALERHLPKTYQKLKKCFESKKNSLEKAYKNLHNISVDYAIMEKARNAVVFKAQFQFDDLGSLTKINPCYRKLYEINSHNNLIHADKVVATVGVQGLIIIEKDGKLLVASKKHVQKVKEIF
ncbi:MAG: mannose-1-phosphate guanylyltransferase [Deltaproteobacteria bacterium]|nr:mannose-1-phosphate guanylyltransferase [Deltaproteobacteria bacterium]